MVCLLLLLSIQIFPFLLFSTRISYLFTLSHLNSFEINSIFEEKKGFKLDRNNIDINGTHSQVFSSFEIYIRVLLSLKVDLPFQKLFFLF